MVSVIVLNYNGKKHLGNILEACLESVFQTDYPNFEVLFVDNASTDGSVDFIKNKYGWNRKLRIIQNKKNFGYAEGNNIGIRNAKGKYIALLNSDTKVDSKWLKELVKAIRPDEIGAAQSKLLLMNNPNLMDCAGGFIDYYGYHHYEVGHKQKSDKYRRTYEIFYAKGAGVIIKNSALKNAGLFDPKIFMYFDETDLCWRIRLNGYSIIFVPTSIVYHAADAIPSLLQEKARMYFATRNHMLMVLKNFDASNLLKPFVVSLMWEIRNIGKFVLKRKPHFVSSIINALLWNLVNLRYIWEQRQITQKQIRKVTDEKIKKLMLKPSPFPLYLLRPRN